MEQLQEIEQPKPFNRHVDTERLIRFLKTISVGDIVTYKQLCGITGRSKQGNDSILRTARKALWKERYFFNVHEQGVGLYRADDEQAEAHISSKEMSYLRRKRRRISNKLEHIEEEALSPEALPRYRMTRSLLGIQMALDKPKTQSTIRMLCEAENQQLRVKDAVQALKEIL